MLGAVSSTTSRSRVPGCSRAEDWYCVDRRESISRVWRANCSARDFDELPDRRSPCASTGSASVEISATQNVAFRVWPNRILSALVLVRIGLTPLLKGLYIKSDLLPAMPSGLATSCLASPVGLG